MQTTQTRSPKWVQMDAGVWVKPAQTGHVEISFSTDVDGSHVYALTAYDERGRLAENLEASLACHDFDEARDIGDRLTTRHFRSKAAGSILN